MKDLNGTKLYLKIEGKGEPLIVVHGGPGMNHTYFKPHLDELAKKYRVVYYDQRSSGKSSIPRIDSITMELFVDDIEAIRKYLNAEKVNILAHSWGSIPAVKYGIKYGNNVDKLILCNAIPLNKDYDTKMRQNQLEKTTSLDSTDASIIKGSPNFKAGKPSAHKKLMLLSFRNSFYKTHNAKYLNFDVPANYKPANSALFAGLSKDLQPYDYYEDLKRFNFPVMIMHAKEDAIPLEADEHAIRNLPRGQLEVFKKSGHFIFIEENKKFIATFEKFMSN